MLKIEIFFEFSRKILLFFNITQSLPNELSKIITHWQINDCLFFITVNNIQVTILKIFSIVYVVIFRLIYFGRGIPNFPIVYLLLQFCIFKIEPVKLDCLSESGATLYPFIY